MFGCMFKIVLLLTVAVLAMVVIVLWEVIGGETIIGILDDYLPQAVVDVMWRFA